MYAWTAAGFSLSLADQGREAMENYIEKARRNFLTPLEF
jgi:hypothetical protein